jgi:hypothetical protein
LNRTGFPSLCFASNALCSCTFGAWPRISFRPKNKGHSKHAPLMFISAAWWYLYSRAIRCPSRLRLTPRPYHRTQVVGCIFARLSCCTDLCPINRVPVDSGHSVPVRALESMTIRKIVTRQRELEYYLAVLEGMFSTSNAPFCEEMIRLMFVPPKCHHLLASMLASASVIDEIVFSARHNSLRTITGNYQQSSYYNILLSYTSQRLHLYSALSRMNPGVAGHSKFTARCMLCI